MANSWCLPAAAVMAACVCATPAYADAIYTCVGQDGSRVLQDTPCGVDSQVDMQKETSDAKNAQVAPGSAPAARASNGANASSSDGAVMDRAQSVKSDTSPPASDSATDDSANPPSEPALGMTQQQVKAILGEPTSVTQEEVVQGKTVTWTYGEDRVLEFDSSGQLTKK